MSEVPQEAVAAAAASLHDEDCDDGDTSTCGRWNSSVPGGYDPRRHIGYYEDRARKVLNAAAPLVAAAAWRDGYGIGRDDEAAGLPLRDGPQ
jgi:hypothetical protein